MSTHGDEQETVHIVVINDEEQYALWSDWQPVPAGWTKVFGPDKKSACLEFVKEHWTDMRPKSLREAMASHH